MATDSPFPVPPASKLKSINPDISSVSRMMAQDRRDWAPDWTESHSYRYGLREIQAQACLDQPGPG